MPAFRWANLGLGAITDVAQSRHRILACKYGEIELSGGAVVCIYPRWWPRIGSKWESAVESYLKVLPEDSCRVYYAFPMRAPNYMSVLYAHSGPNTSYKTLYRGVTAVEEIARIREAHAIVCQVSNSRLSERLMKRLGYVRHALNLGDHHYIKRLKTIPFK